MSFCKNEIQCRSSMISFYFNGSYLPPCGICDNCLRNKDVVISTEEFNAISIEIKKITNQGSATPKIIFEKLPGIKESKIWKVLKFLQEEELLIVNQEGVIKPV